MPRRDQRGDWLVSDFAIPPKRLSCHMKLGMRPINVPQVFDLPPSLSGPGRSCYAVTRALTRVPLTFALAGARLHHCDHLSLRLAGLQALPNR